MSLLHGSFYPRAAHEHVASWQFSHGRYPRGRLGCFCAKAKLDNDAEQEHRESHKGFSIQVPTIPKIGDIESARRLLESAFQNLSFDIPKIQFDSALQGLPFAIPKLAIPMRVFVLDITGFVATTLKKRQKRNLEEVVVNESENPRCTFPRTLKETHADEPRSIGLLENPLQEHTQHENLVGPHYAWPRASGHRAPINGGNSFFTSDVAYPRCAWPREKMSSKSTALAFEQTIKMQNMEKEDILPCTIEGGERCPWPRKSIPAKQSSYGTGSLDNDEKPETYEAMTELSDDKALSVHVEEVAELPRRLLATSVGLTVMNHLAKGSVVSSVFDLCSSLPAGSVDLSDDEGAAMDIGRRTLLVFVKSSTGLA